IFSVVFQLPVRQSFTPLTARSYAPSAFSSTSPAYSVQEYAGGLPAKMIQSPPPGSRLVPSHMCSPPAQGFPRNVVKPLPAASTGARSAGQKPGETPASAARRAADARAQTPAARAAPKPAVIPARRIAAVPGPRMQDTLRFAIRNLGRLLT